MIDIDWGALALVTVTTLIAAVLVVTVYSVGLRLLAIENRPAVATVGAWACIAVGALAVLYGIYLVIPAFHS